VTRNLVAASILTLLFSGRAFAQFDGMDLSDDGDKQDEKK
jgi:hypothetical protein